MSVLPQNVRPFQKAIASQAAPTRFANEGKLMNPPPTNRPRKLVLGAAHSRSWQLAWNDILESVTVNDLWRTFAWNDVMARYRRSRLGQFWITISVAIFIGSIGFFYGQILGI